MTCIKLDALKRSKYVMIKGTSSPIFRRPLNVFGHQVHHESSVIKLCKLGRFDSGLRNGASSSANFHFSFEPEAGAEREG